MSYATEHVDQFEEDEESDIVEIVDTLNEKIGEMNNGIAEAINLLENASPHYDPEEEQDPIDAYVTLYSRVRGAIERLRELA